MVEKIIQVVWHIAIAQYIIIYMAYSSYNYMGVTGGNFINDTWVMVSEQYKNYGWLVD